MLVSNGYSINRRNVTEPPIKSKGSDFFSKDANLVLWKDASLKQRKPVT